MANFWSKLAVQLGRRAGVVSLVGLVLTLILSLGIPQLEFATGQDSYLNVDEETYIDNVEYQDLFGGQAMLSVIQMDEGHTVDELFTPENIKQQEELSARLKADGDFVSIVTPLTAMEYSHNLVAGEGGSAAASIAGKALLAAIENDPDDESKALRTEDAGATLVRANIPVADQALGNEAWNEFILYDNEGEVRKALRAFIRDEDTAQVIVRLQGNQSIEQEGEASDIVLNAMDDLTIEHATVTTTGAPILLKELNDYLRGGMLLLGGIAVGVMMLILLLLFDVRWRLLPLAVVLIGVVWAFGLAGLLGIPLTIVTIAGLPVMLGVGVDYSIQMHARIEEEVMVGTTGHPIQETARKLGPALLVVTFDAVFAFVALKFAKVPMIRDFGTLLAVGIAVICFCSILWTLAILGIREFRSPTPKREYKPGFLGALVVKLGSLPPASAIVLSILSIVIFVGGASVESKLTLQTDPVKWINQSSENILDYKTVESQSGSSSELGVFFRSEDVFSEDSISYAHAFTQDTLNNYPEDVVVGSSLETSIGDLLYLDGASDVAPRAEDIAAAYEVMPPDLQAATVSPDGKAFNLVFLATPGSLDDKADVVRSLRDDVDAPEGITVTPSGLAVVGVGLVDNLESNRILLTYLALGFVFLFLAIRLRSIIRSLLSLVPVLIAVGSASLVAWAAGFELSPMTAVGGPLIVAICTEFTSLILLRFVEERERGLEPKEAADVAAARTGRAFIVSALTGITGVGVLALSSLPLLRDFGLIVAMNLAVALLSALVVLPPMLIWAERRNWVTKGLIKTSLQAPFIDTPDGPADEPAVTLR